MLSLFIGETDFCIIIVCIFGYDGFAIKFMLFDR